VIIDKKEEGSIERSGIRFKNNVVKWNCMAAFSKTDEDPYVDPGAGKKILG
jgi:hypothetical protein